MKGHVKRTIDVLLALDFTLDEEASRYGKSVYRHPYDETAVVKVWAGMSEAACIAVQRKAHAIAETGSSGPALPKTIGERNRILRERNKAMRDKEVHERAARAQVAEQEYQRRNALIAADRNRREIESLMRPGGGR